MTNLLATVLLLTNVTERIDPSGVQKWRTEKVMALVTVPGWSTNVVAISTNTTRLLSRIVWEVAPLKPQRNPLSIKDHPPSPPGLTNNPPTK